jgi:oligosaccharide repeat unit polymerase
MAEIYLLIASCLCITMLIFMARGVTLFTAGGWVVLTSLHGLLIKPIFVYFNLPNAEVLDALLFRSVTRDEYWFWGTISLAAYSLFFAAMLVAGRYSRPFSGVGRAKTTSRYANSRLFIFLIVALLGIGGFLIQFPDLLESMSKNKIASNELSEYSGGGPWRIIIQFAYLVSLCALINAGDPRRKKSSIALFLFAAIAWMSFCYVSDQRGLLLFSVIGYLIAYSRFVKPLSFSSVLTAATAVVAVLVVKTISRLQAGAAELQDTAAQTLANLVGQNFVEHSKMISIIKAVPEKLDFQYGFSYLNSVLVLIPRSLFPEKPFVNLDTTIGQTVFDCNSFGACGIPPGLLAESYLNFGVAGLFVMPVVLGLLVGKLDLQFKLSRPGGKFQIFYLTTGLYLGMAILGSGIASSITETLNQIVLIVFLCLVCQRRESLEAAHSRPVVENNVGRGSSLR